MRSVKPGKLSKSATLAALANPPVKSHPRSLQARGTQTWADLLRQKARYRKGARLIAALIVVATVVVFVVIAWAALKGPR